METFGMASRLLLFQAFLVGSSLAFDVDLSLLKQPLDRFLLRVQSHCSFDLLAALGDIIHYNEFYRSQEAIYAPVHVLHTCKHLPIDLELLLRPALEFYESLFKSVQLPQPSAPMQLLSHLPTALDKDSVITGLNSLATHWLNRNLDLPLKHLYLISLLRLRVRMNTGVPLVKVDNQILRHLRAFLTTKDMLKKRGMWSDFRHNFFTSIPALTVGPDEDWLSAFRIALSASFPSLLGQSSPVSPVLVRSPSEFSLAGAGTREFRLLLVNDGKLSREHMDRMIGEMAEVATRNGADVAVVSEGSSNDRTMKPVGNGYMFASPKKPHNHLEGGVAFLWNRNAKRGAGLRVSAGNSMGRVSVGHVFYPHPPSGGIVLVVGVYFQPPSRGRNSWNLLTDATIMSAWHRIARLARTKFLPDTLMPISAVVVTGDMNAKSTSQQRRKLNRGFSELGLSLISGDVKTFMTRDKVESDLDLIFASSSVTKWTVTKGDRNAHQNHYRLRADFTIADVAKQHTAEVRVLVDFSHACLEKCTSLDCVLVTCGRDLDQEKSIFRTFKLYTTSRISVLQLDQPFTHTFPLPTVPNLPPDVNAATLAVKPDELAVAWKRLERCGNRCHTLAPAFFDNSLFTAGAIERIITESLSSGFAYGEFPDPFTTQILAQVLRDRIESWIDVYMPKQIYGWKFQSQSKDELTIPLALRVIFERPPDELAAIGVDLTAVTRHHSQAFRVLRSICSKKPRKGQERPCATVDAAESLMNSSSELNKPLSKLISAIGVAAFLKNLRLKSISGFAWSDGLVFVLPRRDSGVAGKVLEKLADYFGVSAGQIGKILLPSVTTLGGILIGRSESVALPQGLELQFDKNTLISYDFQNELEDSWFDHKLFWLPRETDLDHALLLKYFTTVVLDEVLKKAALTQVKDGKVILAWTKMIAAITNLQVIPILPEDKDVNPFCSVLDHFHPLLHPTVRLDIIRRAMLRRFMKTTNLNEISEFRSDPKSIFRYLGTTGTDELTDELWIQAQLAEIKTPCPGQDNSLDPSYFIAKTTEEPEEEGEMEEADRLVSDASTADDFVSSSHPAKRAAGKNVTPSKSSDSKRATPEKQIPFPQMSNKLPVARSLNFDSSVKQPADSFEDSTEDHKRSRSEVEDDDERPIGKTSSAAPKKPPKPFMTPQGKRPAAAARSPFPESKRVRSGDEVSALKLDDVEGDLKIMLRDILAV